ncbi:3'-5' exonuclease [Anopheles nili]|uniref:3'-5' exonuclease n=1 Tax=Anopheles nili TaxID=185578 RepID=UPI00237AA68D|nr:3'-5' exonuclease [Anopheles nili]
MSKRVLPLWMREHHKSIVSKVPFLESKCNVKSNLSNATEILIKSGEISEVKNDSSESKSNTKLITSDAAEIINKASEPGNATQSDEEPTKRRLRSNFTFPTVAEKTVIYLPFVEYTGAIEYYTLMHDMAFSCDQLLQWVSQQPVDVVPIAFDLEWPMSFKTGPGKTALLQLCASIDRCLLLQISCLQRLPVALTQLLCHPKVVLHGVNIKNDIRKLTRDFTITNSDRMLAQCVDLGQRYNLLCGTKGIWSMQRLVESVLQQRINKDKEVRMSKWNVLPLSEDQKLYAAIDVYISQMLYIKLSEIERNQNKVKNCQFSERELEFKENKRDSDAASF